MTLSFYIIAGPTAIGKSEFAINLAKKINGNIINADSMQVYKDLEILTARPSNQDTKIIDHHLYGYVRANERYNVEKWCNDARDKIIESHKNNVLPIFFIYCLILERGVCAPEELTSREKSCLSLSMLCSIDLLTYIQSSTDTPLSPSIIILMELSRAISKSIKKRSSLFFKQFANSISIIFLNIFL